MEAGAVADRSADRDCEGVGEAVNVAAAASAAADVAGSAAAEVAAAALAVASISRRHAVAASSEAGGPVPSLAGNLGGGGGRVIGEALSRPSNGVAGSE